ncbi:MAG: DUF2608 domain-containing protein [Ahniella sp.]|nr:DUF2608 domain-containing protein [Ahniella sp.]
MIARIFVISALAFLSACSSMPRQGTAPSIVDEVKDLNAITTALEAAKGKKTLLVLDIDDTLLTSAVFFGSDAWYEWDKTLPEDQRVSCKFDLIAMNFEAGTQVLTQPDAPALVNGLTVDRLMLTSRGANYRGGTIRELKQFGYQLPVSTRQTRTRFDVDVDRSHFGPVDTSQL